MKWNWYSWNSLEEFESWHELVKESLGLPKLSIDKNGKEREPLITEYTKATKVKTKFIAMVSDEFSESLNKTSIRIPKPELEVFG